MNLFLLLGTKEYILENVGNQTLTSKKILKILHMQYQSERIAMRTLYIECVHFVLN